MCLFTHVNAPFKTHVKADLSVTHRVKSFAKINLNLSFFSSCFDMEICFCTLLLISPDVTNTHKMYSCKNMKISVPFQS